MSLGSDASSGVAPVSMAPDRPDPRFESRSAQLEALFHLSKIVSQAARLEDVYNAALEGMLHALGADRAAVLVADAGGVMRFEASKGLSERYRRAVEGHSPWPRDARSPEPVLVADAANDPAVGPWRDSIAAEGIGALAFLPLVGRGGLLGKLMLYHDRPHAFEPHEIRLACAFAEHIAFTLDRKLTDDALRRTEARLGTLMRQVAVGIAQVDADGRFMLVNDRFCEIVGRDREALLGTRQAELTEPGDDFAERERFEALVRDGVDYTIEMRYRRPDDSAVWVNKSVIAVADDDGRIGHAVAICQDITDRKLAEERLREANRRKDEFLAMLGHELRNPLEPILSANEAMRLAGQREPGLDRMREIIDRQVGHMARLLDDLLDVSRISSGRIVLKRSRVDLAQLVRTALDDGRMGVEKAGLSLDLDLPSTPVWVLGDPTRLAQILTNLLHNAIKFTPTGGHVQVRLAVEDQTSEAVLQVKDSGVGLDPEMLEQVFEAFVQVAGPGGHARGGLGLGLALVKGLARLHGGSVSAHSEGPRLGSEFTVRLPLDSAPRANARAPIEPVRVASRRVLIIEDNVDSADSLCTALRLRGHQAVVAYSGREGLELARQFEPEVVLCDIGLPGEMDGYAVARALRRDLMLGSVMLIALTGYGLEEDRRQALDVGFDLHLRKPIGPADLERLFAARVS